MNFRRIPPAPNEEAEMSSEPWYAIGPNDVFPEEFGRFTGDARVRAAFMRHHAELLEPEWWQACRAHVAQGRIEEFFLTIQTGDCAPTRRGHPRGGGRSLANPS